MLNCYAPLALLSDGKTAVGARVPRAIAAEGERLEAGNRVELARLMQDMGLNGQRSICVGPAPDGESVLDAEVAQTEAMSAVH